MTFPFPKTAQGFIGGACGYYLFRPFLDLGPKPMPFIVPLALSGFVCDFCSIIHQIYLKVMSKNPPPYCAHLRSTVIWIKCLTEKGGIKADIVSSRILGIRPIRHIYRLSYKEKDLLTLEIFREALLKEAREFTASFLPIQIGRLGAKKIGCENSAFNRIFWLSTTFSFVTGLMKRMNDSFFQKKLALKSPVPDTSK